MLNGRFAEELAKINVAEITSDLIQIPSYSFLENQEKDIAVFIRDLFAQVGIENELIEIRPGRYNVYAALRGTRNGKRGRSLMLSGHIDTVPAYDMKNAFSGRIADGKIFGRGACDAKGPMVAMIAAMIALKRSETELPGDVFFVGLSDEEEQGRGVEYLLEYGPFCDAVIMGEPTDMKIAIGHKGLEWIDVIVEGRKVHGGNKEEGINAIEMASRFIQKIYNDYVPVLNSRAYPVLGAPTINVGRIEGGDQPSTVPGECIIKLDRRCVPTETISQVYREIEEICNELHAEDPRFSAVIRDNFADEEPMLPHKPYCIDREDPLVLAVQDAMTSAPECPWTGEVTAFPAWSDAGAISSLTRSKCVVMGPGDLGVAYSSHEYIRIRDIEQAAMIYGLAAINYCK